MTKGSKASEFWQRLNVDQYFELCGGNPFSPNANVRLSNFFQGLYTLMSCRLQVTSQAAPELWTQISKRLNALLSAGVDPMLHHTAFGCILRLLLLAKKPILNMNMLCRPFLQWIGRTPLKPSSLDAPSFDLDPQITSSLIPTIEWCMQLFLLGSTASKQLAKSVVEEVFGQLLISEALISPLLPVVLPSVTPELEQLVMTLNESSIFKVLPLILNWPMTNIVADWTLLLLLRLRFLVTTKQQCKRDYDRLMLNWYLLVEKAIDVICKNMFHRQTRHGALRVLATLLNSLQRSPKPFLKALPALTMALTVYHDEIEETQRRQLTYKRG